MVKQEIIMQLSVLQEQANKLEEQFRLIEQQILEMQSLSLSLDELGKKRDDKEAKDKERGNEILANLGKGIFIKADVKDKELFVNVGNNTIVKKDIPETKKIIDREIEKLVDGKNQIMAKIMQLQVQSNELVRMAQEDNDKGKN